MRMKNVLKKNTAGEVVKIEINTIVTAVMANSGHLKSVGQLDCDPGSLRNRNDLGNVDGNPVEVNPCADVD